jgi:predicted nucleotidyltransferase
MREDPVLVRALAGIRRLYGDRLVRIVLFGSRARGEERPESDYDIAVVIRDLEDPWGEWNKLADASYAIMVDTGADVSFIPIAARDLAADTLFKFNMLEEGIDL